jgi:DNA-binding MarR family transcriptional regulator
VVAECACGGLRRAARAISRHYEAALAPFDLTATQFSILVVVNLRGAVPLSRLAEGLVLDRTSLYRAVQPLARRGYLRVVAGPKGRQRIATVTDAGRRLLKDALPVWESVQRQFAEALGARGWASLTAALARIEPTIRVLESLDEPPAAAARRPPSRS